MGMNFVKACLKHVLFLHRQTDKQVKENIFSTYVLEVLQYDWNVLVKTHKL